MPISQLSTELGISIIGAWLWLLPGILLVYHTCLFNKNRTLVEVFFLSVVGVIVVHAGLMGIFNFFKIENSKYSIGIGILSGILLMILCIRLIASDTSSLTDAMNSIVLLTVLFMLLGIFITLFGSISNKSLRHGSTAFYVERPEYIVNRDSDEIPANVVLTVENKEDQTNIYRIEVHVDGNLWEEIWVGALPEGGHQNIPMDLTRLRGGPFLYEFFLFKKGTTQPYRRLALYMTNRIEQVGN